MKIAVVLVLLVALTAATRITIYGSRPRREKHLNDVPLPYILHGRVPLAASDAAYRPLTLLVQLPSGIWGRRLPEGLQDPWMDDVIQKLQPMNEKVAFVVQPSDFINQWSTNEQVILDDVPTSLGSLILASDPVDSFLIIRDRSDVEDLIQGLEEIGQFDAAQRSVRLFPSLLYIISYFLRPLFYKGRSSQDDFSYLNTRPDVKPVAIFPGDEYAMYYPSTYPILTFVPSPPAPVVPSASSAATATVVTPLATDAPSSFAQHIPAEISSIGTGASKLPLTGFGALAAPAPLLGVPTGPVQLAGVPGNPVSLTGSSGVSVTPYTRVQIGLLTPAASLPAIPLPQLARPGIPNPVGIPVVPVPSKIPSVPFVIPYSRIQLGLLSLLTPTAIIPAISVRPEILNPAVAPAAAVPSKGSSVPFVTPYTRT